MEKHAPPLKPLALGNVKKIDGQLSNLTAHLWKLVWGKTDPAIDQKTKYLLSLANAVGANRYRQATRELVKAYAIGVNVDELDELFALFIWNQGVGHFASEIGPSQLFAAYQLIKTKESNGASREEIIEELTTEYGEDNPEVSTKIRT
jgi:alkylhydroperoxidase/carboxymuconolactone decarboxylase family protein YurZ